MANEATLKDLRDRALDYADMTGSGFPVSSRVDDYIQVALSELHGILVNSYEDYFRTVITLDLLATQVAYTLPDDFFKLLKVYYLSGGRRYRIRQFDLNELDSYRTDLARTGTCEVWYIPQYKKIRNETHPITFPVPVGWEDFVCLHAAVRLLMREESDHKPLMFERERKRQEIIDLAEPRDAGETYAISDVYNRWNGGVPNLEERTLAYRLLGNEIVFSERDWMGV